MVPWMVDGPVYSFSLMSRNVICSDLRACLLVFLFLHLGLFLLYARISYLHFYVIAEPPYSSSYTLLGHWLHRLQSL